MDGVALVSGALSLNYDKGNVPSNVILDYDANGQVAENRFLWPITTCREL